MLNYHLLIYAQHLLTNFKLIERIGNLLRSEQRKQYAAIGLQPIHGQVLESLASCITVVAVNTSEWKPIIIFVA